jgi:hypothetical protein
VIGYIESFLVVTKERPPTAEDFVRLVSGLNYRVAVKGDGTAALWVKDAGDPLAQRLAKMLRREPYRTDVLKLLAERGDLVNPSQAPADLPPPRPEPRPETTGRTEWESCPECKAQISPALTPDDALTLCNRVGARAVAPNWGRKGHPATNPCPYHPPTSSGRGGR